MLKLREHIDVPNGADRAALKYAVLDALKGLHPDLMFAVKDIKYDETGFFFNVACDVRRPPEALREVAEKQGLRTMERIGEFSLVDYVPTRRKPYVLRKKDGTMYEAGEAFVKKVFAKEVKHIDAMMHVRKVFE